MNKEKLITHKKMVHKKYIKRGDKIFGPYFYQNYRENGVTKTRYLGIGKKEKKIGKKFIFFGLIILLILVIGMNFFGQRIFDYDLKGKLYSENVNVMVTITDEHPPEFLTRPPEIFVCENGAVDEDLLVEDLDGDVLYFSYEKFLGVPLFFNPNPTNGEITTQVNLFGG